jgi:hypothetical protein
MQLRALAPIASILALTVSGAAAVADGALAGGSWTPVAQTADGVYLLDESSIERRANVLMARELVEYTVPQYSDGVGYRSQLNLRAYRCEDRSWDVLRVTRYTGSLQSGQAVLSSSFDPAEMTWHRATPDSVAGFLLQRVCALAGMS